MAPGLDARPVAGRKAALQRHFCGYSQPNVEVTPGGWTLPAAYQRYSRDIYDFQFEAGDVVVMTYPKSGTTWTQELVWTLVNDPDTTRRDRDPLMLRSPFLEQDAVMAHMPRDDSMVRHLHQRHPGFDPSHGMVLHLAKNLPRPRTIKTHLSFDLLSPTATSKAKVVYVIRDPRDACLSYYHHCQLIKHVEFSGTLDQFIDAFMEDAGWFNYWQNVSEAWKRRDHPSVHIMFYERTKKHPQRELRKLAQFLELDRTDEQLDKVLQYCSFPSMAARDQHISPKEEQHKFVNVELAKKGRSFFRSGKSGGWREDLSPEQKTRFEEWITANVPDPAIMEALTNP